MEFTCNRCGLTYCGILIGTTPICEDCFNELHNELMEGKGMTFTEAIQKYNMITNDGGKTIYKINKEGTIFKKAKGYGGAFSITVDLLTSTGWEEYKENKLKLVTSVEDGSKYYTISGGGEVCAFPQRDDAIDRSRLSIYKYFTNREFAQYVADKQLIQRIELTLIELNKDRFPKEELTKLINKYLRDNHMEVLDRIIQYEL